MSKKSKPITVKADLRLLVQYGVWSSFRIKPPTGDLVFIGWATADGGTTLRSMGRFNSQGRIELVAWLDNAVLEFDLDAKKFREEASGAVACCWMPFPPRPPLELWAKKAVGV